ncbi:hypothetical protein NDI54_03100 [Haloarcula sp. S1AR25-5A]|uniref:Uncharacterized protein n=1 Tax=Haloarcula terrestris TaxID=2950533 RepID=A0AAE4EX17_9EURY|nr:hypothetical protein [Haloarcula terrestris]MDS0220333.1 hypothetical protein [Haloarcula terrestris]
MDTETSSQSKDTEEVEFYVPATFQFSTEPGAIERVLVGLFHDRSDLEARVVAEEPTKEFYTPAMFQFSTDPSRIERFLKTVFRERGEQEFRTVPDQFVDLFYLPATSSDRFRQRTDPSLAPAAEVLQETPPD